VEKQRTDIKINYNYFIIQTWIMFKQIYDKIQKEISGEIALGFLSEISRHHRIQASPGHRNAVKYAVETLSSLNLKACIDSYSADGESYSWSSLRFKEWSCNDAELRLVEPVEKAQFLARWSESKLCLIQRSYPTPAEGFEAEVVVLDKGEEQGDYKKINVSGKFVLTNGDLERVREIAVEEKGAIGIIFDGTWVRPPALLEGELDDALRYTSFWWSGSEKPCFGFVLTPRKGRWLRKLVMDSKKPVILRATVDSNIYVGEFENAMAIIEGESEEEVLVVTHICHPQPSCNDNASGSAAAMEAARALKKLIDSEKLPKPKRSIRFTLVPEMAGTYNYLAANEEKIPSMVAALNLDMVGERQDVTVGPLIVEKTPESSPSFVNALMEAIFEEIKREAGNLGGSHKYALFKHAVSPFSGGSDHYIYSDPTVGIPCPMVIQWPDKFWHTSFDTIDKVDPQMLKKVAILTATYAYFIANAGQKESIWLANEVAALEKKKTIELVQRYVTNTIDIATSSEEPGKVLSKSLKKIKSYTQYLLTKSSKAMMSVKNLCKDSKDIENTIEMLLQDQKRLVQEEKHRAESAINNFANATKLTPLPTTRKVSRKIEKEATRIIPKRVFKGPISIRPWQKKLSPQDREKF
jgi:hypothetical protein